MPPRSPVRRNANRRSPSSPYQPRVADSSGSPRIDFTGYRKIASIVPISVTSVALVAVVVGLVRAVDRHAEVFGLRRRQRRQLHADLREVEAGDLLVELLRQDVDLAGLE